MTRPNCYWVAISLEILCAQMLSVLVSLCALAFSPTTPMNRRDAVVAGAAAVFAPPFAAYADGPASLVTLQKARLTYGQKVLGLVDAGTDQIIAEKNAIILYVSAVERAKGAKVDPRKSPANKILAAAQVCQHAHIVFSVFLPATLILTFLYTAPLVLRRVTRPALTRRSRSSSHRRSSPSTSRAASSRAPSLWTPSVWSLARRRRKIEDVRRGAQIRGAQVRVSFFENKVEAAFE